MRQLLFAFAGMVLLISCTNTADTGANTGGDNNADRNAEATRKVYRAIETGDVSGIDTLFTEDVIDHNGGIQGEDVVGRDSVKALLAKIHTFFDGLKIELLHHATSTDGQYHYATVRMTGKAKQNPWGMPVGMDIDDTSVDLIKLRDGKAAEHWGFLSWGDINEMMKAMGGGQPAGGGNQGGGNQPAPRDTSKRQ